MLTGHGLWFISLTPSTAPDPSWTNQPPSLGLLSTHLRQTTGRGPGPSLWHRLHTRQILIHSSSTAFTPISWSCPFLTQSNVALHKLEGACTRIAPEWSKRHQKGLVFRQPQTLISVRDTALNLAQSKAPEVHIVQTYGLHQQLLQTTHLLWFC